MRDNTAKLFGGREQLIAGQRHFVDNEVGPFGGSNQVPVKARVTRYHNSAPVVDNSLSVRRFDERTVIHSERRYFDAVLLINHAVFIKFVRDHLDSLKHQQFIRNPDARV